MPTHSRRRRPSPSVSITVQPPAASAPGSYTVPGTCGTLNGFSCEVSSWFWTSRSRSRPAATTAVPSGAPGEKPAPWSSGVFPVRVTMR
jgi:hypothetical protein